MHKPQAASLGTPVVCFLSKTGVSLICVVKGKGEQTELQTQAAGSARICVSVDGVEQVLSSRGLDEGWLEETLAARQPVLEN